MPSANSSRAAASSSSGDCVYVRPCLSRATYDTREDASFCDAVLKIWFFKCVVLPSYSSLKISLVMGTWATIASTLNSAPQTVDECSLGSFKPVVSADADMLFTRLRFWHGLWFVASGSVSRFRSVLTATCADLPRTPHVRSAFADSPGYPSMGYVLDRVLDRGHVDLWGLAKCPAGHCGK